MDALLDALLTALIVVLVEVLLGMGVVKIPNPWAKLFCGIGFVLILFWALDPITFMLCVTAFLHALAITAVVFVAALALGLMLTRR